MRRRVGVRVTRMFLVEIHFGSRRGTHIFPSSRSTWCDRGSVLKRAGLRKETDCEDKSERRKKTEQKETKRKLKGRIALPAWNTIKS